VRANISNYLRKLMRCKTYVNSRDGFRFRGRAQIELELKIPTLKEAPHHKWSLFLEERPFSEKTRNVPLLDI